MSEKISMEFFRNQKKTTVLYLGKENSIDLSLKKIASENFFFKRNNQDLTITIILRGAKETDDLSKLAIEKIEDWKSSINKNVITLNYEGTAEDWQGPLELRISNLIINGMEGEDYEVEVNFAYKSSQDERKVRRLTSQSEKLKMIVFHKDNANLTDVIDLSLEQEGQIFVSKQNNPLFNKLNLVIKNEKSFPLYHGLKANRGNPRITVEFVYGNSIGSLVTDEEEPIGFTAWDIRASKPRGAEGEIVWALDDSDKDNPNSGTHKHEGEEQEHPYPKWRFKPEGDNVALLGTGKNSTITIPFSNIFANTPIGHTSMHVHFSGFKKNDTTLYNDEIFTLDIIKKITPDRGVLNFSSEESKVDISDKTNNKHTVTLKWTGFAMSKAIISTDYPTVADVEWIKEKEDKSLLQDHSVDIFIPNIQKNRKVTFTIQAFGLDGEPLKANLQWDVTFNTHFFHDAKTGQSYNTAKIGNRIWMVEDLRFPSSNEDSPLYKWETAVKSENLMKDWRLPTKEDWLDLMPEMKKDNFNEIFAPKNLGLKSQSGFLLNYGNYYWSATAYPDNRFSPHIELIGYMKIDRDNSGEFIEFNEVYPPRRPIGKQNKLAIRLVKDL